MRAGDLKLEPSLAEIALQWGRIGCVGFGGPPAHVALFRDLCVTRKRWLSDEQVERALAAANLLPGPASTQLAIYCGWRLRGPAGALLGGLGFVLPGLLAMRALAAAFLSRSPPSWLRGAGMGAGAAVAAVAVRAGVGVAAPILRRAARRAPSGRLAPALVPTAAYALSGGVGAALAGPWLVVILLACGAAELGRQRSLGEAGWLWAWTLPHWGGLLDRSPWAPRPTTRTPLALAASADPGGAAALAWTAFKVGALAFGGGFVIVPLMQSDAVDTYHWMTHGQFLNAVALGQVTPGPVTHTVAAVGYSAAGVPGALLAALIAFAPSFSFVLLGARRFERLLVDERARAFLGGAARRRPGRSSAPPSRWARRSPRAGSSPCSPARASPCSCCVGASSRPCWPPRWRASAPPCSRCLLRAWLAAVELDHLDAGGLIAYMQDEGFSHVDLYRRACRAHERKLRLAVEQGVRAAGGEEPLMAAAVGVFDSCMAAIPYAPATAFLANEHAKLDGRCEDGETPRVAILADGIGSTHGVTRVIEEIRQRGVDGFEIEILGTDPGVDRRLSAVAELDVPYYPGLRIGVPSLSAAVQTIADGAFDVIHACSPGPVGVAGALVSRAMGIPLLGSYHTELTAYAGLRSGEQRLTEAMARAVGAFYRACDLVLSPSPASDAALAEIGAHANRVARWDRGVDSARFDPALRDAASLPGAISVLYAGRITREKGIDLLAEAFLRARALDPRLRLVLAGGGPEQDLLRERVGEAATFLGWLEGERLARAYASADVLLFPSRTDTFGQVILEAQASGLAVVAVAAGGPLALIEDRVNGLLRPPDADALAGAVLELAGSPLLRERLARAGLQSARRRTWEHALGRLAGGYRRALRASEARSAPRAA